ncbi:NAD-dependent epimerase/dehydratase family protein [Dinghuibacter silviterrae]|uniref:Nucleoside-diphosphate-sugar epimerase n=1 Tax=Dinghuibacter silviterrae TaxID=1539049 RepID=A0A4R8DP14_9BACT|nr:NAD-dependent epimerase/dehydratase family protein [Dinghuibacter silviterrae]TDW99447.1 nucleoside-diphosphate-sugar epimerase [Dinghuibacter silviterrae]
MQTILGANGVIAKDLAKYLLTYTTDIRLVSRHPRKINDTDTLMTADLLDREQVIKACAGSEVVYLTAGIQYSYTVWKRDWPVIMDNVIEACKRTGARLVFFSNVYSLGRVNGWMTESSPMNPSSKKGAVRKQIEEKLLSEVRSGSIQAIIARAPDFYGPDCANSVAQILVFDNLHKGKKPQWMVSAATKHSMIYTPDAARATAILGNTPSAFNRIWNLPTARPALTGKELLDLAAKAFGRPSGYTVLPKWMLSLTALFIPNMRSMLEMLYQNKYDYLFDSSDFEKTFAFAPTSYEEGIRQIAATYR